MRRLFIALIAFAALGAPPLWAQDNPDDDFFSEGSVEAPPENKEVPKPDEAIDKESLTLSGDIQALGSYTFTRDFLWGYTDMDDNALSYLLTGDFLLDARLRKGFRAFLDLNVGYSNVGIPATHTYNLLSPVVSTVFTGALPNGDTAVIMPGTLFFFSEDQNLAIGIKELFVDFNIANAVYFRVGKQVLQWGTGYLWNPTDLINIEKKSFFDISALRQGQFGLRVDFVFDRAFHLYSYVEFEGAEDFSQMAVAGKAEFLIGQVETSLSAWWKGGKIPVFGWDLSAPLFWDINFHAEAAVSWGDNLPHMDAAGNDAPIRDQLVARVSAGFSRGFTVDNDDNRVILNGEFYFNSSGYEENMFEALSPISLATFLTGYYDSGNYGKYYGMVALTVNKFLVSQLTFTLSGIGNFSDMSFIAMADFAYTPVYDFTIDFKIISYLGLNNREYTIAPTYDGANLVIKNNMFGASISCNVKF
ncbi:MAG: hypothetical protein JXD23_16730 [Spirochaetales bacterium]|nr:hypothetical protein [Spirochaetales bacterium]